MAEKKWAPKEKNAQVNEHNVDKVSRCFFVCHQATRNSETEKNAPGSKKTFKSGCL
jgi:hypothetical protein